MVRNSDSFRRARSENAQANASAARPELFDKAKDDRKLVGFRMDPALHHELKVKAVQEGTTLQELLMQAVEQYMQSNR